MTNDHNKITSFEIVRDEIALTLGNGTTNTVTRQGLRDMYQRKLIFVVTIEPTGEGGVGGVEWRTEYREAEQFYVQLVQDLQRLHDPNLLGLWACLVPEALVPEEITNYVYDGFVNNDPETSTPLVKKITETCTEPEHLVVTGNPVDGFTFTGPFTTAEDATTYAETMDESWWIATIDRPTKD